MLEGLDAAQWAWTRSTGRRACTLVSREATLNRASWTNDPVWSVFCVDLAHAPGDSPKPDLGLAVKALGGCG